MTPPRLLTCPTAPKALRDPLHASPKGDHSASLATLNPPPGPLVSTEDKAPRSIARFAVAPDGFVSSASNISLDPRPITVRRCQAGRSFLAVWDKAGGRVRKIRWRCNSWRCPGKCSERKASQDFARIREALERAKKETLTYSVLTFDRKRYRNSWTAHRAMYHCFDRLRKRLNREFGRFDYVATAEVHRDGWPHLNVVFASAEIARYVRTMHRAREHRPRAARSKADKLLRSMLVGSGFGRVAHFDPCRGQECLAGYISKIAGRLSGEVVKLAQTPLAAPPHFRRIRSSRGFLPPARRSGSGKCTGALLHNPRHRWQYRHGWIIDLELSRASEVVTLAPELQGRHFDKPLCSGELTAEKIRGLVAPDAARLSSGWFARLPLPRPPPWPWRQTVMPKPYPGLSRPRESLPVPLSAPVLASQLERLRPRVVLRVV